MRGPESGKQLPDLTPEQQVAFWASVNKTESCWLWTGRKDGGYGIFWTGSALFRAHRLAKAIHSGKFDPKKLACHTCRNRHCVNPAHIELGDIQKNTGDDRRRDGTIPRGENSGAARLMDSEILQILDLGRSKLFRQCEIAEFYGVSQVRISQIISRGDRGPDGKQCQT